jgi:predicted XRE-type DNA-binding protein
MGDVSVNIVERINENEYKAFIYENRYKIGVNLLSFIKDNGYTKSSISKLTGISRPTIDKLIKGEVDNNTTLKSHIDKIVLTFNITIEQLIKYEHIESRNNEIMVASNNAPEEHEVSDKGKRMFTFLEDIVDLCEIYSDR